MNKNYLLGLAFLSAAVIFLIMPNVNFFEESTKFATPVGQNMITAEADGTITLVPVKKIDTAINDTVDSLKSELNPVITQNTSGVSTNASAIATNARNIAANTEKFGSYIRNQDNVYLQMGEGHSGSNRAYASNRFAHASTSDFQVRYNGRWGGKWKVFKAPNERGRFGTEPSN